MDSKAWSGESEEEEREDSGSSSKDDTVGHYEGKKGDTIGECTCADAVEAGCGGRGGEERRGRVVTTCFRVAVCLVRGGVADTMVQEVGVGTFGRVLECTDRRNGRHVAIKMVRSIKKYTESAKIEAEILEDVRKHQEKRRLSLIVELFGDFEFRGRNLIVVPSSFPRGGRSCYHSAFGYARPLLPGVRAAGHVAV